jgi:hypothetical protein
VTRSVPPLDDYVDTLMASRPSLTDAQRERLRFLLNGRRPVCVDAHKELEFREYQAGLLRRRQAALRLPQLGDGRRDPLMESA